MKQLAIPYLFFVFLSISAVAQTSYPMGLDMDDEAYEQAPYSSENIQVEDGRRFVPSQLDLSPYCPEIRHQGDIASCVGWSVGYGAMTMERAIKNNWKDRQLISEKAHSALFVYNHISQGNCDKGISLIQALDLLQVKGNCLARDFDFDINDCAKTPPEDLVQTASNYRIADYIRLFPLDAEAEEKIKKTKLLLAQKKPVAIGMKVLQNFYNIGEGDKTWWPNLGNTTYAGGHAMVVVGYDDHKFYSAGKEMSWDKQGAFKLMNSWGRNWGQNGFIWVRYADYAEYCRYAFTILLEEGPPIKLDTDLVTQSETPKEINQPQKTTGRSLQKLSGSFGFRHYTGWNYGPVFEEAAVQMVKGEYRLRGDWKLGDQFQLYTKSEFDNGYIYVMSIDQTGKAEVHFPRSYKYNKSFEGQNESALIMTGGSVLTIPTQESVLKLTQLGKEHLLVLFSTKKIKAEYIDLLCQELAKNKHNISGHLHKLLNRHMVPGSDINYHPTQMGFEASTRSGGKIIPIVLTVDVSSGNE